MQNLKQENFHILEILKKIDEIRKKSHSFNKMQNLLKQENFLVK